MVVLLQKPTAKQANGAGIGPRNPLILLQKLQQANIQRQVIANTQNLHHPEEFKNDKSNVNDLDDQCTDNSTSNEDDSKNPKRFQQLNTNLSTTSSSSLDDKVNIIKKTNMQEKIFKMSCDKSRQHGNIMHKNQSHSKNQSNHQRTYFQHKKAQFHEQRSQYHQSRQYHQQKDPSYQLRHQSCQPTSSLHHSRAQSNRSRNTFNYSKPCSATNINNSISSSGSHFADNERCRQERFYHHDLDEDWTDAGVQTSNVLHLKDSMLNESNENNYVQSRGRMEPMNWSDIDRSFNSGKRSPIKRMNPVEQDRLKKIIDTKPEPKKEFLNFVENSIDEFTVYEVYGNLEERKNIESPLLKMQRMLKKNTEHTVTIPTEVLQIIKQERIQKPYLINKIDQPFSNVLQNNLPISNTKPIQDKQLRPKILKNKMEQSTTNEVIKKQSLQRPEFEPVEPESISQSIDSVTSSKKKQLLSNYRWKQMVKAKSDLDSSYDVSETLGRITKSEGILKYHKRQKELDDYDDNMFSFCKSISTLNESTSYASAQDDGLFINKDFSDIVDTDESTSHYSQIQSFNSTLSVVRGSDVDDLSISKRSLSFEVLKTKLSKKSSPASSEICKNTKIVSSKKLIESLNASKSDSQTDSESKVIKIDSIKVCPKENFLMVAKETRYFKNSNVNSKENAATDSVQFIEEQKNNFPKQILQTEQSIIQTMNQNVKNQDEAQFESLNVQNNHLAIDKRALCCEDGFTNQIQIINDGSNDNNYINNNSSFQSDKNVIQLDKNKNTKSLKINITNEEDSTAQVRQILNLTNETNRSNSFDESSDNLNISDFNEIERQSDKINNNQYSMEQSLTIEEINSNTETKLDSDANKNDKISSCDKNSYNNSTDVDDYDEIDGFEIVNFYKLDFFKNALANIKSLQAAQKAHALGEISNDELNSSTYKKEINNVHNNEMSNKSSSLEISCNNYSTASASVSSNINSDEENCNHEVYKSVQKKQNIFGNVKIDINNLNCNLNSDGNEYEEKVQRENDNCSQLQSGSKHIDVKRPNFKNSKNLKEKLHDVPKYNEADETKNLFKSIKSNSTQFKNEITKDSSVISPAKIDNESGVSKKMMKLKRAMNGYQKNLKLDDDIQNSAVSLTNEKVEDAVNRMQRKNIYNSEDSLKSEQTQTSDSSTQQDESPIIPRPRILQEIKKRKLHLSIRADADV